MPGQTVIDSGTVPTICRQCDMRCGILADVEAGRLVRIRGMTSHPQNRGRLCPKGLAAIDTVYHPQRLLRPLKRRAAGGFEEIPLEQAMGEIAERLGEIGERHGRRSIACWHGEALGFAQQEMYPRRFLHALGSPNFLSVNSVCFVSRYIAYRLVQGYWNPCPDFANAACILLWGTNPPVSHFTFMGPIEEGLRRGARLVVIDPLRSEIARRAHLHLRPWPGTDGALAWGLIRALLAGGRHDRRFVEEHTVGFPEAESYARGFSTERVARETGVSPADLEACAGLIGQSVPRVVNYVGVAMEHQENGVNTVRAIACLGGLAGAVDREGGDPWPEPLALRDLTLYERFPLRDQQPIGSREYPVLYDLYRECNTPLGVGAMLGEGPYRLRALIVNGGNPANTNPNAQRVSRALGGLDLLVVRDLFHTETTALAHYVLPAASFLERTELHLYAHYQWISLSRRVLRLPGVLDEYAFWRDLAHRLGFGEEQFPWAEEEAVNAWLLEPTGLSPQALLENPEGLRYAPVRYGKHKERPFPTPSGRFELSSAYLQGLGYPPLPEYQPPLHRLRPSAAYPMLLISGARKREFLHSRYRNLPRLRRVHPRPVVELHPADAERLGLADGQEVRVCSETGWMIADTLVLPAEGTLPGLVQITHGWEGEANVNRLTMDGIRDPISGFPLLTSVPVRLEPVRSAQEREHKPMPRRL